MHLTRTLVKLTNGELSLDYLLGLQTDVILPKQVALSKARTNQISEDDARQKILAIDCQTQQMQRQGPKPPLATVKALD